MMDWVMGVLYASAAGNRVELAEMLIWWGWMTVTVCVLCIVAMVLSPSRGPFR